MCSYHAEHDCIHSCSHDVDNDALRKSPDAHTRAGLRTSSVRLVTCVLICGSDTMLRGGGESQVQLSSPKSVRRRNWDIEPREPRALHANLRNKKWMLSVLGISACRKQAWQSMCQGVGTHQSVAHAYSKSASSPAKDGQLSQERKRINDAVHEARLIVSSKWCAATTCHIQHLQVLATWA